MYKQVPSSPKYSVSKAGKVRLTSSGKQVRVRQYESNGYLFIGASLCVHRMVAEAWVGPLRKGYVVNHKDGNKTNNRASNFEIVTARRNTHHAIRTGLRRQGTETIFTSAKVRAIRKWVVGKSNSIASAVRKFGGSRSNIEAIVEGRIWRDVGGPLLKMFQPDKPWSRSHLSETKVKNIRIRCVQKRATLKSQSLKYGVSIRTIQQLVLGETYKNFGGPTRKKQVRKLSFKIAEKIRALKRPVKEIARKFGISIPLVEKIRSGERWVSPPVLTKKKNKEWKPVIAVPKIRKRRALLTNRQAESLRQLFQSGKSVIYLSRYFEMKANHVVMTLAGKLYKRAGGPLISSGVAKQLTHRFSCASEPEQKLNEF